MSAFSETQCCLFVENIPSGLYEDAIVNFFNQRMHLWGLSDGIPVRDCQISPDETCAHIYFGNADETTAALAFNGIMFMGQYLKVSRPRDYQPVKKGCAPLSIPVFEDTPSSIHISAFL